jgi:hypothetical protein
MLLRAFIALLFVGATAAFGYGFWLVLSPDGHQWEIEIPLDPPGRVSTPPVTATVEPASDAAPAPRPAQRPAQLLAEREQIAAIPRPPAPAEPLPPKPISLSLPIACDPGVDCWVINYVDADPGPEWSDFLCTKMSYKTHKGTDFGLANDARIADDVPVLAAAAGTVVGVRDGEPDLGRAGLEAARAAGRNCGNGVRIDHGEGWATQYCHMRKGSVLVSPGQTVEAGQSLGAVGLSGTTEFAHVHMSLSRDGEVVDPYRGVAGGPACSLGVQPLWDDDTMAQLAATPPPVIVDLAFSDRLPDHQEVQAGLAARNSLGLDAQAVVLWFRASGVAPGDTADLVITDPNGATVLDQDLAFEKHQIFVFRALGKKNSASAFPNGMPLGTWTGRVILRRDGRVTADRSVTVAVPGG